MTSRRRKSKRRSGTSIPPEKQLERYTFFVERSLGENKVAQALRNIGLNVERHKDRFAQDANDVDWLAVCGQRGWVVLTKDKAIRYNELELAALISAGVATFVIASGEMRAEDMSDAFIKALPQIARFLKNKEMPFIARVSPDGVVAMWIDSTRKDHMKADQQRRQKQNERRKKHAAS
jgi:predicted nuclease of predicted toxin-antitoxin system